MIFKIKKTSTGENKIIVLLTKIYPLKDKSFFFLFKINIILGRKIMGIKIKKMKLKEGAYL